MHRKTTNACGTSPLVGMGLVQNINYIIEVGKQRYQYQKKMGLESGGKNNHGI